MTLLATLTCWAVLWLILAAAFYVGGRLSQPPRPKPAQRLSQPLPPSHHYGPTQNMPPQRF